MTMTVARYTAQLGRLLRFRGLDEEEIRDAVRTVEAHVHDAGQSPETAFGTPRAYARTFPTQRTAPRGTRWYVLGWLVASLAGMLLWFAIDARRDDAQVLGVADPTLVMVGSILVLVAWVGVLLFLLLRGPRR